MKIDLRRDKGLLKQEAFQSLQNEASSVSEDDLVIETLKKRHSSHTETPAPATKKPDVKPANKHLFRQIILMVLMIASAAYYLHDRQLLQPMLQTAKETVYPLIGLADKLEVIEEDDVYDSDSLMSDDLFEALMPVTEDIAALADSLAALPDDSSVFAPLDSVGLYDSAYTPVDIPSEPIHLTEQDIQILNNRSLQLMAVELLSILPQDLSATRLEIKRDALTLRTQQDGDWVDSLKNVVNQFVIGNFSTEGENSERVLKNKYEIVLKAERDFEPVLLDELGLLDVLAHPFDKFLDEILIDLSAETHDNPAIFTFTGSSQIIQFILSSWSKTPCNYLLRSLDIQFQGDSLKVTIDVIFFNYHS